MFKLYLILLMGFLRMPYFMSEENYSDPIQSPSDSPEPNILPLVLIKKGRNFTHPTKIEKPSSSSTTELPNEPLEFSGDSGEQQILLCGAKPPSNLNTPSSDDYCNYSIKFEKSDPLKCVYEPEPLLLQLVIPRTSISIIETLRCGPYNEGIMYHFAYKICVTKKPIEYKKYSSTEFNLPVSSITRYDRFEVYKMCIEEQAKAVFFTEHKIFSPRLLDDQRLKHEREKLYNFRSAKNLGLDEERLQQQYQSMGIVSKPPPLKDSKSSAESLSVEDITPVYKGDKFVPSEDFAFALWRKPTFDFFNLKKMEMKQIELWNHISKLIREDAIKHNREYYIHTAAYKLFLKQSASESNPDEMKTVVVWVKTVYQLPDEIPRSEEFNDKNKAIAIIVDSHSDTNLQADLLLTTKFGENLCKNTSKKMKTKSVRCCSILYTKPYLNEESIEIDEDLRIESLYDNEDDDDQNNSRKKIKFNVDLNLAPSANIDLENYS